MLLLMFLTLLQISGNNSVFEKYFFAQKIYQVCKMYLQKNVKCSHSFPYFSLSKICENTGFLSHFFSRIRKESKTLSLYGKIQVRENTYFDIFYAV